MPNVVVVGAQWGDEGKGKIVDVLCARARAVVRFQGGNNAGHTLVVGDRKLVVHLIPSGILRDGCVNLIGNGVVVDPRVLVGELDKLEATGVGVGPGRLVISQAAHVIMPYHTTLDGLGEEQSGEARIGTTRRGIGPCYEDKVGRRGVRIRDLLDPALLAARLDAVLPWKNRMIVEWFGGEALDRDAIHDEYTRLGARLAPLVGDVVDVVHRCLDAGDTVVFEGAQGTWLDVDHGTYPFVTSSTTLAGGACAGSGVGPGQLHEVIGIAKAYCTRVGEGPFPTEDLGPSGNRLREVGGEFGSTTGRPRRCGWFDAVLTRRASRINGLTRLALTKLDVLTGLDTIPVCVGYEGVDGVPADLANARPIYRHLPGWKESLDDCRTFDALPSSCQAYVRFLEQAVDLPIDIVSVGAARSATIVRRHFDGWA